MAEITKQYTYRIPDTYFGDTWEQKKTALLCTLVLLKDLCLLKKTLVY